MITTSVAAVIAMTQFSAVTVTAADERQVSVRADDLDLSGEPGVARFRARIGSAVNRVCPGVGRTDLGTRARQLQCKVVALRSADAQVEIAIAAARTESSTALAAR